VTTPHPAIKSGTSVHCLLLEEKTKKGGWKAQTIEGGLKGHILPDNEPLGIKPGDRVELVIHGADPKNLSFRWPRQ
jgi:CRISPR-associated protein Cmr6